MKVIFVSIDSVSISEDKNEPQELLEKLDSELHNHADWKIVFAHYPCYSGGAHHGSDSAREKILPIMEKHHVDVYLTGHDHNLQHWQPEDGPFIGKYFLSSAKVGT